MSFKKLDFEKAQFQNGISNAFQIGEPIVPIESKLEFLPRVQILLVREAWIQLQICL